MNVKEILNISKEFFELIHPNIYDEEIINYSLCQYVTNIFALFNNCLSD